MNSNPEPTSDEQRGEARMSLKCRHCGWTSAIYGTNGKAMLATLENAHTSQRPECPTAKELADV